MAALSGKTILYVPIGDSAAPFFQEEAGLKAALAPLNMTVTTCDPEFSPTAAATCMGDAKLDNAIAVVTSGIPYAIASTAYQNLVSSGIPTLAANTGSGNPANTNLLAFMPFNSVANEQGRLEADEVIAKSGGKGKILYLYGNDSPVLEGIATVTEAEFCEYAPSAL